MHLYRRNIGLHAFDVDGVVCLAAACLDPADERYRYRYAVLCGGEAARRALRTAELDHGDSDEPGPGRRITVAVYDDYVAFIDRLPTFIADVSRSLEKRIEETENGADTLRRARRQVTTLVKRRDEKLATSARPLAEGR